MNKQIIIIGAGIAGLSAGCYAQMNGYDTQIYEMHNIPGGLCTSWKRNDYTFDGCIHWLIGSNKDSEMNKLWREIGALNNVEIINHDQIMKLEIMNTEVILYSDLDKLKQHLLKISVEDTRAIKDFTNLVKKLVKLEMPLEKSQEQYNSIDAANALQFMKYLKISESYSIKDYFEQNFKSKVIKELFTKMIPEEYSLTALVMTLADYHKKNAGYPVGGSFAFSKSIADKYQSLGGVINYQSKVKKILVENNKAFGIVLENGEEIKGDYIISASNGYSTIYNMLEGKYINNKINELYTNNDKYKTFSSVQVSLGINYDLSDQPHNTIVINNKIMEVGGVYHNYIPIRNYSYDKTMAPKGKSVVTSLLHCSYEYWEKLKSKPDEYKKEKQKIADIVIDTLESKYPGIKEKIEVIDVATPTTYERYAQSYRGAYMSFITTPETGRIDIPYDLPNLENMYMIGMWTMAPGGLPAGLLTGKSIIRRLCKKDKTKFITI